MMEAYVRASALVSALGPDLGTALARIGGEPRGPARDCSVGREWPYFPINLNARDWMERADAIAAAAAGKLRSEAGLTNAEWAAIPCVVGSSSYSVGAWDEGGWSALQPPLEFCQRLVRHFGAGGPVMMANTACTSGLVALDLALGLLDARRERHVLVLGTELANRLTVAGFAGLELLSSSAARPCDRQRDGLVLGEALGAVLLSGTPSRWRIAALASGTDPDSLTGPAPSGERILEIMRSAVNRAQWPVETIDCIKLQAGGGRQADLAEGRAVRELFARVPPAISFKGAIGHTLGASGPAELALLLGAVERGRVPDTWGFAEADEELGIAPRGGDARGMTRVLFNLSGFGGNVMSLALERRQ